MTEKRLRAVNYDLEEVGEELPDEEPRQGRIGEFRQHLNRITVDPKMHNKWYRIAAYRDASGATTRRNKLVRDYGNHPSIAGWQFATRKIDEEKNGHHLIRGLYVKYTPDAVEEGHWERWQARVAEEDRKLRQKQQSKQQAKPRDHVRKSEMSDQEAAEFVNAVQ